PFWSFGTPCLRRKIQRRTHEFGQRSNNACRSSRHQRRRSIRTAGHHRVVRRHRFRMVRLLPLRDSRSVLRGSVLPAREPGGAATYVAEHSADHKRGYTTAWIQTTATVGMLFSLVVIGITRSLMSASTFSNWGWRISFWVSIPLLAISVYIRLKLQESPVFQRMKTSGKRSKSPISDSFLKYPNNRYVALALFGATAGQGVVWYTGQFYALFFLLIYLKLDFIKTYWLVGLSLVIATPFFLVFGALSDRIGRLKIILA